MRAKGLARKIHQPHHRESEQLGNCKSFFLHLELNKINLVKRPDFNSAIWEFVKLKRQTTNTEEIVGDFDDRKVLSFPVSSPAF